MLFALGLLAGIVIGIGALYLFIVISFMNTSFGPWR